MFQISECFNIAFPWEGHVLGGWYDNRELIGMLVLNSIYSDLIYHYGGIDFKKYKLNKEEFDKIVFSSNNHNSDENINNNNNNISDNNNINNNNNINYNYNLNIKQQLPLVPDVIIPFRCTDILAASHLSQKYGFVSFSVYASLISNNTKSIYVTTEGGGPSHERHCKFIVYELVVYLSKLAPNATIAVTRGKTHINMVQIALAKLVISPPSTFVFWPALANKVGQIYFLESSLIAIGSISNNFNWIKKPKLMNFYFTNYDQKVMNNIVFFLQKKSELVTWK
jgi:hypothetical protein